MKSKRLLLIDFDCELRTALARALSDAGYAVQAYGLAKRDWQTIEARLQNGDFDAIVIDPETFTDEVKKKGADGLAGIELLEYLKKNAKLPPIVVYSWCYHRLSFPDQELYKRGVGCIVDKIDGTAALLEALNCLWETQDEAELK